MIERIKAFLHGHGRGHGLSPEEQAQEDLKLATAAVLIETATMDGYVDGDERSAVTRLLSREFDLDADAAENLLRAGEEATADSPQLYGFTRTLKDSLTHEQRVHILEMLWEVAYADKTLHDFEANLIRRIAGLLYVPDRESGEARKRVLARLQT